MTVTENTLEFDKIKEMLEEMAYTKRAKEEVWQLRPYMSENELRQKLRDTTEARFLLEKAGQPPLTSLEGMEEIQSIARAGGMLTAEQLERAGFAMTAVKRLKDYLKRCRQYELGLPYYEENLDALDSLREELQRVIRGGRVDDYASKTLRSLRSQIERARQKMREKADSVLRANKSCLSDQFSTFRSGHICIPVKKEYKSRIQGNVIDQSATGNTVFIEPAAAAKLREELDYLQMDEENEVRRILYVLTGQVAQYLDVLKENQRMIEKLDFIFAKGKLSMAYDGTEPEITLERKIVIEDGRHPLMEQKNHVPLQFEIGTGYRGVVITGPNTGGKTVAMKTVAINCIMAQCGLHVACKRAVLCMNNAYLCDIGDGQNLSENLSTFSAHIINVLDILKKAGPESLVVMDELGSGTDPAEGMGIAVAILEELKKSGALYLVTTHYPEVKQYAEKGEGMVNARMTFDKDSLKPLYQLVIGEAGESCALYIAQKLGMPSGMLRMAAKAAYGEELPPDLDLSGTDTELRKESAGKLERPQKTSHKQERADQFNLGDSVMLYPEKKIGIVCCKANRKGVLQVQLPGKKIWINHKRVKLHVAAAELYPEDYDFSILFESVANRKLRHTMERKYVDAEIREE